MTEKAAGAGAEGEEVLDDGQGGSGAPSGGSPKGGSGKGSDEFVPVTQLKAALKNQRESHEREIGALRAEFQAFAAGGGGKGPQDTGPKRYDKAELKAAVAAERITQDQMEDLWEGQIRADAVAAATKAANNAVTQHATKESVDSEISKYTQLAPEVMEDGSEVRNAVHKEFQALVRAGMSGKAGAAETLVTQLAALKAVLGPLEKLEKSRNAQRSTDTHQESGGGGGEHRGGNKPKGDGVLTYDSLTSREKAHYDKLIGQGVYKDKAAVNAELKFANSRTRAKHGARA